MTQHVNDHMMNVVGPAINDGLAAYFKGDPFDQDMTLGYRFSDGSLDPVKGNAALTFTRAGIAKVADRYKMLREVPADVPRFPGAIYRNNLVFPSNNLLGVGWTGTLSVITGGIADPYGGNNAFRNLPNAASASWIQVGVQIVQGIPLRSRSTQTLSAKVRGVGGAEGCVIYHADRPNVWGAALLDFATGTITSTDEGNGILPIDAGAELLNDGWYRVWVTTQPTEASAIDGSHGIGFSPWLDSGNVNPLALVAVTYDGVVGLDVLEPMFEEIAGQPTNAPSEYIETTTAAVTVWEGPALGVQVEPAATNICLQSEDFAAAPWAVGLNGLINSNQFMAPDGTVSADLLIDDASGGEGQCLVSQNVTLLPSTQYTLTKYYHASGLGWANLRMGNLGTLTIEAYFQLSGDGVVGPTRGANNTSEFIENVGNGWYKCGIRFTSDAVDTAGSIQTYLCDTDGDRVVTLNGGSSILVWGADLEVGPGSSYIKTTTVPADRVLEGCTSADLSDIGDGFNHTIYVKCHRPAKGNANCLIAAIGNDATNNYIRLLGNINNTCTPGTRNAVGTGLHPTSALPAVNGKCAIAQDSAGSYASVSGGAVTTFVGNVGQKSEWQRIDIGKQGATFFPLGGIVSEFAYGPVRKPDSYLQSITTP